MFHLLLIIIYLAFISLGLPDSLLGSVYSPCIRNFLCRYLMPEEFP